MSIDEWIVETYRRDVGGVVWMTTAEGWEIAASNGLVRKPVAIFGRHIAYIDQPPTLS